ncbi:hypothetical protein Dip510_001393 [Elusimicrobium posterum]
MDISKYLEEFNTLESELATGSLSSEELQKKSKRHAFLRPIVEKGTELENALKAIKEAQKIIKDGTDKEMAQMAAEEIAELEPKVPALEAELRILVIPPDPNDSKNIYLEIRPGAGGMNPQFSRRNLCACTSVLQKQEAGKPKFWNTRPQALKAQNTPACLLRVTAPIHGCVTKPARTACSACLIPKPAAVYIPLP